MASGAAGGVGGAALTPVDPNDWRLQGQDRWCRGPVFKWARWEPRPAIHHRLDGATEPAVWDHDHCEFCWREFGDIDHACSDADGSPPLAEGWTARGPGGRPEEQRRENYH